jgi:hypothetical protein
MNKKVIFRFTTLFLGLCFPIHSNADNYNVVRKNSKIVRMIPIKCIAEHYTWTGMLSDDDGRHEIKINKSSDSSPIEVTLLEKLNKLMVDNEEFKIVRTNSTETFAVYINDKNVITVVLNYAYGTLLYSKVFTNVEIGKQNAMTFVGVCKNG